MDKLQVLRIMENGPSNDMFLGMSLTFFIVIVLMICMRLYEWNKQDKLEEEEEKKEKFIEKVSIKTAIRVTEYLNLIKKNEISHKESDQ